MDAILKYNYGYGEVPMAYETHTDSYRPWGSIDYSIPDWRTGDTLPYKAPLIDYWDTRVKVDATELDEKLAEVRTILERRDEMISRRVFNEALAEEGVSKSVRRRVEKLSSEDFEYLIASLLATIFDPEMLKVFEPEVQKVKVVEE